MSLITPVFYTVSLTGPVHGNDTFLPISPSDMSILLSTLTDGDHTYLVYRDPMGIEIIRVERQCGVLVVTRGQDGTPARAFPKGACLRWEMTPAVVKDIVCSHDCCGGPCPCVEVEPRGVVFPPAQQGVPWHGSAVFSGDLPIATGVTGMPAWMSAVPGTNYVTLTGVPSGPGSFTVSIAASNCGGAVCVQAGVVVVT